MYKEAGKNKTLTHWTKVNRYFPTLTRSVQRTKHCLEIRQTCESIHPFHHWCCHHPPDLLGLTTEVVIDQMQIYQWKGKIPMFWSCFESFWHEWDGCRRMLKGRGVRRCPSIVNDQLRFGFNPGSPGAGGQATTSILMCLRNVCID